MDPTTQPPYRPQETGHVSAPGQVTMTPRLPESQPEPPKGEGFKTIASTLAILIAAPIIAFILTTFVFQSYEVDGPSMETTLNNRDRLLVLKTPKTLARIFQQDYIPDRGDIIIFETTAIHDGDTSASSKQLIKRVLGVPGDRVLVDNGVITIYNNEFPEGFNPDKIGDHGQKVEITSGNIDVTVKPGEVFVFGDNRANSLDSRAIGTIPSRDIIGKLIFRIYPLSDAQKF